MKHSIRPTIIVVLVMLMMIIELSAIVHEHNYIQDRVKVGNERWEQVEERIIELEERIEVLENGTNG